MPADHDERDSLLGQVVDGRFRLDAVIGEGGMGRVYRATQLSVDRAVAVKVVRNRHGLDAESRTRFFREARIVATLNHPNIVRLLEFGEDSDNGIFYLAMDFVEGRTLKEILQRGRLEWKHALQIGAKLADGLAEAHAHGIVHRDLKPANIIISRDRKGTVRPMILDFGLARVDTLDERLTTTGVVWGTPDFMAPEQASGGTTGPVADLYALGVILFELITGESLFDGPTPIAVMQKKVREDPPPTIARAPELPSPVAALIDDLICRDPERRVQSGLEVIERIREVLDHRTLSLTIPPDLTLPTIPVDEGLLAAPNSRSPARHDTHLEEVGPHHTTTPLAVAGASLEEATTKRRAALPDEGAVPSTTRPTDVSSTFRDLAVALALVGVIVGLAFAAFWWSRRDDRPRPAPSTPVNDLPASEPRVPQTTRRPDRPAPAPEQPEGEEAVVIEAAPESACGGEVPFTGVESFRTALGSESRKWEIQVPDNYASNVRHRVLLLFHDNLKDGPHEIEIRDFRSIAEREHLVVIAPTSQYPVAAWQQGDDVDFVTAMVRDAGEKLCLDTSRVFAVGHGSGGRMVQRLACKGLLAAGATTAFRSPPDLGYCAADPPVPIIQFVGKRDRYNPEKGGSNCRGFPSTSRSENVAGWTTNYRCQGKPTSYSRRADGECESYDCAAPLVFCETDGGHEWSGESSRLAIFCGEAVPTKYPYRDEIWKFFARHETQHEPWLIE